MAAHPIKKRIKLHGFDISVENPKGSSRHWKDPHSGESGTTVMKHDYGYFRRTEGTDGDHVDVYVGPDAASQSVFIIDQMKKPDFKRFDEQKVMLGFKDANAAKAAYLKHYNDPRFFGSMKEMGIEDFRSKVLDKKNHGEKIAATVSRTKPPYRPDPQVAQEVKKSVESFLVSKGLPKDTPYALLAGASMYFHGLRPELKDADIVVQGLGKRKFNEVHGKYEVDGGGNIDDLGRGLTKFTIGTRHTAHGVQFASLPATLAFKKALNREKDQADIKAIQQHMGEDLMPFTSKRQQRAAFGGHIPGFSKEKAKEWAKETPDMKGLPERAPAEKGKHTLRAKKAELAHAHDGGKGLSEAAIARGVRVELEHTKDPGVARQIAIDHLRERPDYYARLADAEKSTMRKKSSLQNRSQAHTNYFVEMNLAKLAAGEPVAPVLGERRRSAGVGDNIPPQTDFAQAVEGDPVKAASDDRVSRISDRIDDVGIGLLAAPYAASAVGHGLAKSTNPKLRAAGAALERGFGTESSFGKSHGRELAGLAMVAPGVTHTVAKGINTMLPKEKGASGQTVLSEHSDPPGYMMVQNLNRLTDQSKQLAKAVSVKDNAEPWVESKIDRASEAIDAVHDYMKYKAKHRENPKEASVDLFLKMARDTASGTLSAADRDKIKTKNFALPKEEKYPIHDEEHARNALARVAQFGSPSEQAKVRAAVSKKYPGIDLTEASTPEKKAGAGFDLALRAINASIQADRERAEERKKEYRKHAGIEKIAMQLYPEWEYLTYEEQEKIAFSLGALGGRISTGLRNFVGRLRPGASSAASTAVKDVAAAGRGALPVPSPSPLPRGAWATKGHLHVEGQQIPLPTHLRGAAAPKAPAPAPAAPKAPAPAPAPAQVRQPMRVNSPEELARLESQGYVHLDPRNQMVYPQEAFQQYRAALQQNISSGVNAPRVGVATPAGPSAPGRPQLGSGNVAAAPAGAPTMPAAAQGAPTAPGASATAQTIPATPSGIPRVRDIPATPSGAPTVRPLEATPGGGRTMNVTASELTPVTVPPQAAAGAAPPPLPSSRAATSAGAPTTLGRPQLGSGNVAATATEAAAAERAAVPAAAAEAPAASAAKTETAAAAAAPEAAEPSTALDQWRKERGVVTQEQRAARDAARNARRERALNDPKFESRRETARQMVAKRRAAAEKARGERFDAAVVDAGNRGLNTLGRGARNLAIGGGLALGGTALGAGYALNALGGAGDHAGGPIAGPQYVGPSGPYSY